MARRKRNAKHRRPIKRGRPSRSSARANAKQKKPSRKVAAKRSKAVAGHKATTRIKPASRRKFSAGKKSAKRVKIKVAPDPTLEIAVLEMNRGLSRCRSANYRSLRRGSTQIPEAAEAP